MADRPVIAIPGDDPPQLQDSPHLARLDAVGECRLFTTRPRDAREQIARSRGAVCIVNSRSAVKWPAETLRQLPELRMMTTCGIGTDAIDVAAAGQLGIVVCNVPGATAGIVAEHALALLLATSRRVVEQTQQMRHGTWRVGENTYLRGKTLGVLGAGPIGAEMMRLGRAIGMRVLAWTFHPSAARASALGVEFLSLEELLKQSQAVSIHLPLTAQSRGLLGRRELSLMPPGALLINTARGAIVDTEALVAALNSGHLGGAGLDVFDPEPFPADHPLLRCERIVVTPHVADQNPEGMELLNRGAVDNVLAFLRGEPTHRVV